MPSSTAAQKLVMRRKTFSRKNADGSTDRCVVIVEMLWPCPCQARAAAENKRLSSNLRSGAALVNESLGIIADALRPGERDREVDTQSPALPTPPPPAAAASSAAPTLPAAASDKAIVMPRQPTGNPTGQAAVNGTVAQAGTVSPASAEAVVIEATAAASGVASRGGFARPAGWPEEDPVGFRGGLLRDMDHG
jgi:hypothetical protein